MKKYLAPVLIGLFSVVGFFAALEALGIHYGKSESAFCDVGGNFDCDLVNQSVYSQIYGIPFALIGMIGYGLILAVFVLLLWRRDIKERELLFAALCAMATIGLGVQVYLTMIEMFVLQAWCLLCLISQVSIVTVTITAWIWRSKSLSHG